MVLNSNKIMQTKLPTLQTLSRRWEVSQQLWLMLVSKRICCRPMKRCFSISDSRQRLSRKISLLRTTKAWRYGLDLGFSRSQQRSCILVCHSFKPVNGALILLKKMNNTGLMESGLTVKLPHTNSKFHTQESQWPDQFSRTAFPSFA